MKGVGVGGDVAQGLANYSPWVKDGFDILKDCRQKGRYRLYVVCTTNVYICLLQKRFADPICNLTGEGSAAILKSKTFVF